MPIHEIEVDHPALKTGYIPSSDSCSWVFAIYEREAAEKFLGQPCQGTTTDAAFLTGWHREDNGPGRGFAGTPSCRVYKHKVIVVQHHGLDI